MQWLVAPSSWCISSQADFIPDQGEALIPWICGMLYAVCNAFTWMLLESQLLCRIVMKGCHSPRTLQPSAALHQGVGTGMQDALHHSKALPPRNQVPASKESAAWYWKLCDTDPKVRSVSILELFGVRFAHLRLVWHPFGPGISSGVRQRWICRGLVASQSPMTSATSSLDKH